MCFVLFLAAPALHGMLWVRGVWGDLAALPGEKDYGAPQIPVTALCVLTVPISVTSGHMWLSVLATVLGSC